MPEPTSPAPSPVRVILVMGVSGSGKSTVGRLLAETLGWPFADADDFHPAANVAKMSRGEPLTDEDRRPWLGALRQHIAARLAKQEPGVVACSALKAAYRAHLLADSAAVAIVYLKGSRDLLARRLGGRRNHFMPLTLLDSQLATLEEPEPGTALVCDIAATPAEIVHGIRRALRV